MKLKKPKHAYKVFNRFTVYTQHFTLLCCCRHWQTISECISLLSALIFIKWPNQRMKVILFPLTIFWNNESARKGTPVVSLLSAHTCFQTFLLPTKPPHTYRVPESEDRAPGPASSGPLSACSPSRSLTSEWSRATVESPSCTWATLWSQNPSGKPPHSPWWNPRRRRRRGRRVDRRHLRAEGIKNWWKNKLTMGDIIILIPASHINPG